MKCRFRIHFPIPKMNLDSVNRFILYSVNPQILCEPHLPSLAVGRVFTTLCMKHEYGTTSYTALIQISCSTKQNEKRRLERNSLLKCTVTGVGLRRRLSILEKKPVTVQSAFSTLSQCFVTFSCISCEGLPGQ